MASEESCTLQATNEQRRPPSAPTFVAIPFGRPSPQQQALDQAIQSNASETDNSDEADDPVTSDEVEDSGGMESGDEMESDDEVESNSEMEMESDESERSASERDELESVSNVATLNPGEGELASDQGEFDHDSEIDDNTLFGDGEAHSEAESEGSAASTCTDGEVDQEDQF